MRKSASMLLFILMALLMVSSATNNIVSASGQPLGSAGDVTTMNRASSNAEQGEQIARDYLLANTSVLGLSREDMASLHVTDNYADDLTGSRYIYFLQTVNGLTIHNAMMNVTILPNGDVLYVGNRGIAGAAKSANGATPTITAREAIDAAAGALELAYSPSTIRQESASGGAERAVRYSGGDLSLEYIPVKLVYQPTEAGSLRLAWDLNILQQDARHWWHVRVDAATGELLDKGDWAVNENWDALLTDANQVPTSAVPSTRSNVTTFADHIVAPYAPAMVGSYRVYQIPVESPNHATPLPPADGRVLVANPDLPSASPFGWHDTNGAAGAEFTTTQGNNVHAYTDIDNNGLPDAGSSPDGGAGLVFDFPLDLTQAPSTYRPAAVTNLFYWNNLMHDIPHLYGFNEVSGNFQVNNYGNGGLGNDDVRAEAQDGGGINNANFLTPPDGQRPRMQMYLWNQTTPQRDGDLDNGIIAHEYGHGISNRLTGGPSNVSCLGNAEQMGEGWSDWQSVILTMRPGDTATTNRGVGTYALGQPTNGVGIRPAPYNTNFAVNNFTYSNLPGMAVPHGVGFVWNTMLWEMNWELINDYGFEPNIYDTSPITEGGNILAYRLVSDGMKIQPCNPGFVDGRNAILAADVALTGGDNECAIWAAFARRGLGFSASQGSSGSTTDGTAATDLPPQCTGGPTFTPTATNTPTATLPPGQQIRTYCSTFTPISLPDNNQITGTLSVPDSFTILDANLRISMTHSFVGDLIFTLRHGATSAVAVDRPGRTTTGFGCGGDNILGSYVDDEGMNGTWESSCNAGTPAYPPNSRLIGGGTPVTGDPTLMTAFDGQNSSGTWSLNVSDNAGGDTGTLNAFCMELLVMGGTATPTNTSVPSTNTPTATPTNTSVPPTNTPTATPTNTTVPSTNTPTATPTNTTVPSTNTPTATPGSGNRVCSTVPIVVPDNLPAGATGTVNVALAGNITDLNVILTGTHSWVGDLAANISNGSTNVTFYDRPGVPASTFGCSGDNLPGVFGDDEGADGSFENSCQNATPAYTPGGHYTNNNPLSAFDGQPAAGTWTLTVSDNAGGDTGTITGWCVEFETGTGPTATPTSVPQVPDINVTPAAFEETHSSPPQTTNAVMNIQNVGTGTLNWTIAEDDTRPWNNPNPPQPRDPNAPVERQGSAGGTTTSKVENGPIVGDGSFEAGTPNPEWEEFSSNFGTPLCDESACGLGGGTGPRTGLWWAWFGGTTAAETGILTQTVTIPSGSAELSFWLEIPPTATGTNGFLSVRMDGTEVFRAEETTPGYGTYAEVTVDVSAYADGGAHELVFFSTTDAGSAVTNFFVDDVAITATAGGACSAPTDIPWLTVSPTNGSTAGGGSTPVTLTFNSATLAQGTYTGTLCVESNDPDEALVTVPVTLNVGPPTAIDLSTFAAPVSGFNPADLAAAGLLLLAGAVLILRRK